MNCAKCRKPIDFVNHNAYTICQPCKEAPAPGAPSADLRDAAAKAILELFITETREMARISFTPWDHLSESEREVWRKRADRVLFTIGTRNQEASGWIPLPKDSTQTNGGQKCDMLVGPCACGAWHKSASLGTAKEGANPSVGAIIKTEYGYRYDPPRPPDFSKVDWRWSHPFVPGDGKKCRGCGKPPKDSRHENSPPWTPEDEDAMRPKPSMEEVIAFLEAGIQEPLRETLRGPSTMPEGCAVYLQLIEEGLKHPSREGQPGMAISALEGLKIILSNPSAALRGPSASLEHIRQTWLLWRSQGVASALNTASRFMVAIGKIVEPDYPADSLRGPSAGEVDLEGGTFRFQVLEPGRVCVTIWSAGEFVFSQEEVQELALKFRLVAEPLATPPEASEGVPAPSPKTWAGETEDPGCPHGYMDRMACKKCTDWPEPTRGPEGEGSKSPSPVNRFTPAEGEEGDGGSFRADEEDVQTLVCRPGCGWQGEPEETTDDGQGGIACPKCLRTSLMELPDREAEETPTPKGESA